MKPYEPKSLVAVSRYQKYFPTLPADVQRDIYARMGELIEEEGQYCDKRASVSATARQSACAMTRDKNSCLIPSVSLLHGCARCCGSSFQMLRLTDCRERWTAGGSPSPPRREVCWTLFAAWKSSGMALA